MKTFVLAWVVLFSLQSAVFAEQEVSLDQAAQKRLSLFFSNFSEADVPSFAQGELTDAILLNFALSHCQRNLPDKLPKTPDRNHAVVDAERVNTITERFFGARIGNHATKSYTVVLASGEAYVFSQIDRLFSIDPSTFSARGTIYSASSGSTLDPYASPATWKKQGEDVQVIGTFKAVIRKTDSAKDPYVLEGYTVTPK